jgi:hypothetical protein
MTLHLGLFLFTYSHYKLIYQCTVNFYVFNAGLNKLNVISRKPLRDITASQQNQFGAINVELSSHNNQTLSLPKRGRPKQILSAALYEGPIHFLHFYLFIISIAY